MDMHEERGMHELVVDGAIAKFQTDGTWNWKGWDGRLKLRGSSSAVSVDKRPAVISDDVILLYKDLVGKKYAAIGFEDKVGTVRSAVVRLTESSLSKNASIASNRLLTLKTHGEFTLVCAPSVKKGSPPVPDPFASKREGKWVIESAEQSKFLSC
jgi:hypothetical protein